jgi:hypothetical protein
LKGIRDHFNWIISFIAEIRRSFHYISVTAVTLTCDVQVSKIFVIYQIYNIKIGVEKSQALSDLYRYWLNTVMKCLCFESCTLKDIIPVLYSKCKSLNSSLYYMNFHLLKVLKNVGHKLNICSTHRYTHACHNYIRNLIDCLGLRSKSRSFLSSWTQKLLACSLTPTPVIKCISNNLDNEETVIC